MQSEFRAIQSRLRQIPEEVARLDQEVATERANAKAAEDRLNGSKKARRALESELELAEAKIGKYKDQLMLVKTNDEYRAMQKQIENAKEEIRDKEDRILAKMEEIERLHEELGQRGRELEKGRLSQGTKGQPKPRARLSAELERRNAEREELMGRSTEPRPLSSIGRIRGGVAVAEAKDGTARSATSGLSPGSPSFAWAPRFSQANCSRFYQWSKPDSSACKLQHSVYGPLA
jgi:predicted  nucleic acid-binding Zn-ribbon protein